MRLIFDDPEAQDEGRSDPALTIAELKSFDETRWCDNIRVMTWLDGYQELMHSHTDLTKRLNLATKKLDCYKGKFDTFEAKVDFVRKKLSSLVNWPMSIAALVLGFLLGYGSGINDLPGVIAYLKRFFGY